MRTTRFVLLALVFMYALCLTPGLCAQEAAPGLASTVVPVPGAGHNYLGELSETVDPASGSVSLRISVPLPKGRALALPFYFAYDSNGVFVPYSYGGTWTNFKVGLMSTGGWSYTVPAAAASALTYTTNYRGHNVSCGYTTNYRFLDASGGRHGLGLLAEYGNPLYCANTGTFTHAGVTYQAAISSTNHSVPGLVVVDPSGTTYSSFSSEGLARIEDRNGNFIQVQDLGVGAFTETDTAGRQILSSSGFGASGNTLTVSGLGSPYQLNWESPAYDFSVDENILQEGNLGCSPPPTPLNGTLSTVQSITLPNGQQYTFQYDPQYALLSQVTYPSGAWVKYTWGVNAQAATDWFPGDFHPNQCMVRYGKPALQARSLSFDGVNTALTQTFQYSTAWPSTPSVGWTSKQTVVTTNDLVRGTSFTTTYNYAPAGSGDPIPVYVNSSTPADTAVPVEQTISYADTNTQVIKVVTKGWVNAQQLQSEQVSLNGNSPSQTTYTYGPGAQITEKDEYDFGQSTPSRKTVINYQSFAATPIYPDAPSIFDRPSSVITYDGSGNRIAEADYSYDQPPSSCSGSTCAVSPTPTNHDETKYAPSSTAPRGNATTITRQCFQGSQSCTNAVNTFTFDETGQILSMTDPCGNATCSDMTGTNHTTTYSYADSYTILSGGQNVSYTPSGNTNAYLTKITDPLGHTSNFTYDFNNGQLTASKDQNGQTTTYVYNDSFARPTLTNFPDGGKTTITYNDAPYNPSIPSPSVTTTRAITSSANFTTLAAFDGLGHTVRSVLTSDPDCGSGDRTDTTYDGLARVYTVSNPYCTTGDATYGTTTYAYDALGRTKSVTEADGSVISTSYSGNCTTVTDEAGKTRQSCSDGLGRLTQVTEDPGSSPHLNYLTTYSYDALDNLLSVMQSGSRQRTFTYDSLSRLLCAANPEIQIVTCPNPDNGSYTPGTIRYAYDSNGNLATKTAPAPNQTGSATVTTTYSYDALNRLTMKTYSDGTTRQAGFYYDSRPPGTFTNAIGRLVTTWDGKSEGSIYNYDPVGRITSELFCIEPTKCWMESTTFYQYDLLGDITSYSNTIQPYNGAATSSITFNQSFDSAGRATNLTSSLVDAQHPETLAIVDSTAGYYPTGQIRKLTLGNGLTQALAYNNRLQPCRMNVNSSASYYTQCTDAVPGGNLLDLTYGFNSGTANNGNIASWSAVGQQSFNRSYTYDSLNRIATMADSNTGQSCRGLSWTIDPWGNRTDQTVTAGTCNTFHQTVDTRNRLVGPPYQYDAAGNMTNDGSHTYTYDAENRLIQVDGGATASYIYDPSGRRVSKTTGGTTTNYVYDLAGNVLFESQGNTQSATWVTGYNYFAGGLLAEYKNGTTYFVHKDHLGSTRLVTAFNQFVVDNLDYLPFGEQIAGDTSTTHKFTGKERDGESGLDNFGARYDASSLGRFMTPDPLYIEAHRLADPQRLNLYAYARNNPVTLTDPNGLDVALKCDTQQSCQTAVQELNNRKGHQFKVELGKDGKLHVIKGSVAKNLSKAEGALLAAINDTENHATINVSGNSGHSEFGSHNSPGVNSVDLENLSKLDAPSNAGGLNSGDVLAHEALDAYNSLSMGAVAADSAAAALFPGLLRPTNVQLDRTTGVLFGQTADQAITNMGPNILGIERITIVYNTPIPFADLGANQIQGARWAAGSRVTGVTFVRPKQ